MKNFLTTIVVFIALLSASYAQEKKKGSNGYIYGSWGYNKDWFSKSDIHFAGTEYDFTIYQVTAHDRPNFDQIFAKDISIPQFIYRVGYIFGKHPNLGIEISFDHAKYIMDQNIKSRVAGRIHDSYVDMDTLLTPQFIRFEHTNGANFLMFNVFKRNNLHMSQSGNHQFIWIIKPGAGMVIPQSSVAIFNKNQDNKYHIAGYVIGLDNELHYEYKHGFFAETGVKYAFANYMNVLAVGNSKANHHFSCLELLLGVGFNFAL